MIDFVIKKPLSGNKVIILYSPKIVNLVVDFGIDFVMFRRNNAKIHYRGNPYLTSYVIDTLDTVLFSPVGISGTADTISPPIPFASIAPIP